MFYSSFGALALVLHLIINYDILIKRKKDTLSPSAVLYRQYLLSITVYYISDLMWGLLNDSHITPLVYADTFIYFLAMAASVLLWTRYLIAYIDRDGAKSRLLLYAVRCVYAFMIISLAINFFKPVIFSFPGGVYTPGIARYIIFGLQFMLFLILSLYSFFNAARSAGNDRIHYLTSGASGAVLAIFTIIQILFPFLPFYAIGSIIATCLIHVFVEEDEKIERDRELQDILRKAESEHLENEKTRREKEIYNNIAESLAENYEAIYYIDIETGRYQEFSASSLYESMQVPKYYEDFYKETRENARRYAHPDDAEFAESLYYKDTMIKNLKGRRSYSYKYRLMVEGRPRYFTFIVMLTKDNRHFVLCEKDIHDEITAENMLKEDRKKHATFSQIAESLAENYDVIYYVDTKDGSYIGYSSRNIYGQLVVDRSGDDFFEDAAHNVLRMIHPQDRDRLIEVLNRDYLLTALEDRKQFTFEYRLIIDDSSKHTRMSVRRTGDHEHFMIGVENIDDEVRKEKEHLKALNTEKELARRDELTGTRNKTAYSELERSVQQNMDNGMDYLPFAIAVCDINDLKKVNDTEGHKAGDDYIRSAAKLLCDIFDHSPVFRIGGDEFVIFLRGDDYSSRDQLMSQLRETVMANLIDRKGPVIASGMSEYIPGTDTTVSAVFERADNIMYKDKRELKRLG